MERVWIALALGVPFIVGLLRILASFREISKQEQFVEEFVKKFAAYYESSGKDSEAYGWLIHRSYKMQRQLGADGLVSFRPPFANYIHNNYPVVLNILPELRRALGDSLLSRNLPNQYAMLLHDILIRHIGRLQDWREAATNNLRNPIIWLREGVRTVVALPFTALGWLGLISEKRLNGIVKGRWFNAASSLASLIGFASAVMGIVLGWKQFLALVADWHGRFF